MSAKLLASRSKIFNDYFFKQPVKKAATGEPEPAKDVEPVAESTDASTKEPENPFDDFESQVLLVDEDFETLGKTDQEEDKVEEEELIVDTEVNIEALDNLFQFLENFDEINYVLAGYFNKVVTSFINGDHKIDILSYFFTRPNLAEDLIKHVYCRSIATLLSNFMNFQVDEVKSFDSKKAKEEQEEENLTFVEIRINLFRKLVNRLLASSDSEVIDNISMVFDEFFSKCGDITESQAIYEGIFFHKETLDTFFKIIYTSNRGANSGAKTAAICKILTQALNTVTDKRESTDNNYDMEKKYFEKKAEESSNDLTQIIIDNIDKLVDIIQHNIEENQQLYTNNIGLEKKRLGVANVNLVNLIHSFLKLNNEKVNTAIGLSKLFPFLLQVFIEYPWNNIFHCTFYKIFELYLKEDIDSPLFTNVSLDALSMLIFTLLYSITDY